MLLVVVGRDRDVLGSLWHVACNHGIGKFVFRTAAGRYSLGANAAPSYLSMVEQSRAINGVHLGRRMASSFVCTEWPSLLLGRKNELSATKVAGWLAELLNLFSAMCHATCMHRVERVVVLLVQSSPKPLGAWKRPTAQPLACWLSSLQCVPNGCRLLVSCVLWD